MKKLILVVSLYVICNNLFCQIDTVRLSLKQAIQYGLSNRFDIKVDSLDINIAESRLKRIRKELIPDLVAGSKTTYFGEVQPSIIPAGFLGFTEPRKITIGMKNNTSFALDLTYTAYNPGLYTDIKIAQSALDLEREKDNKFMFDVRIQIAEAYYNVLLRKLQYEIARRDELRFKNYFDLIIGKFNNGAVIESDALQSELDYRNASANTEKQKQNYLLSIQFLKYRINLQSVTPIVLTDSMPVAENSSNSPGISGDIVLNRSEIRQLVIEKNIYALELKRARENSLPSLSLFANYTNLFQGPDFRYSEGFYWAPVSYVGVRLSIPISGNIRNVNSVNENKFRISRNDFMIKQKTSDIDQELQQAITRLSDADKNYSIARNNYDFSQKIYELKKQQYFLGSFQYEKLLDLERTLNNAEQDYISSVFELLMAKITLQKVTENY